MDKKEQEHSRRLPGFYIALCCCVIAIGIAGYFTEKNTNDQNNMGESILSDNSEVSQADASKGSDSVAANKVVGNVDQDSPVTNDPPILEYTPENSTVNNTDNAVASANANATVEENTQPTTEENAEETAVIVGTPAFIAPSQGNIIADFSQTLAYNNALGDWRTHNGIDIAIESGGSVTSIADGTVKEISSNEMGEYIVISHDGGFESKYCCLSSVENLNVGDAVKSGDVLGIVTESKGENVTDPHIHLELYKDSELVNPSDYIQ